MKIQLQIYLHYKIFYIQPNITSVSHRIKQIPIIVCPNKFENKTQYLDSQVGMPTNKVGLMVTKFRWRNT